MSSPQSRGLRPRLLLLLLILIGLPAGMVSYKVYRGGYDLRSLVPVETFKITTHLEFTGYGDTLMIRTFLPQPDQRVTIRDESLYSDLSTYKERYAEGNRIGEWSGQNVWGDGTIRIEYTTFAGGLTYEIDPGILVSDLPVAESGQYLEPTPFIQSDDPAIAAVAERLAPAGTPLIEALQNIHRKTRDLGTVPFKGMTDARTVLYLGEASCNGKSRLFVALARNRGIPARLVGGLILESGEKRTSHQWVEVLVGPRWIPFCPTNDHFASIPANYIPLYRGDRALFSYTKDINFDYEFRIKREFAIRAELLSYGERDPLNLMGIWKTFEQVGIPFGLLKVLLMIPLGALVLVILRYVVGLVTFGTFLPVLIAVASRNVGLLWGLVTFLVLILLVFAVRFLLVRLSLLHLPQMAILLTATVVFILTLGVIGVRSGYANLANIGMFPIAIMAITTERAAITIEEEGLRAILSVALMTCVVIAACYLMMNATSFQILFLTFPELVLVVILVDIWLGHWTGLRLTEYWRFRGLIGVGGDGRHA